MAQQKWSMPCKARDVRSPRCGPGLPDRSRKPQADIGLDGMRYAVFIRSGGVMAAGNWIFAGVVDRATDEARRRGLGASVSG
jgi:hypothetical protein